MVGYTGQDLAGVGGGRGVVGGVDRTFSGEQAQSLPGRPSARGVAPALGLVTVIAAAAPSVQQAALIGLEEDLNGAAPGLGAGGDGVLERAGGPSTKIGRASCRERV